MTNNNNNKYFIYVRKSSDDKDRQVQSIDDQVKVLTDMVQREGLQVVKATPSNIAFSESGSAKEPHKRKEFYEMLKQIKKGKADGIICWKLDRLTRNPVDSGTIQWMLQRDVIKSIKTPTREYLPEDNALILSVETGVANQFIIDLRRNTARGVKSKVEKGWYPSLAPMGYLNSVTENQGENYILKDSKRFDLVRKMWDMMLTGAYTVEEIRTIANKDWDFTTKKFKRKGGKPIARSSMYRMFTNVFYTGLFEYSGEIYKGKHPSMITIPEYDRVQSLLGRAGRPRPKKHQHAYIGWARCGECDCAITATKKKKILSTGEIKFYTYYHCTGRKEHIKCSQKKYIVEQALEEELDSILEKVSILPQFKKWAMKILRKNHQSEVEKNTKIFEGYHKSRSRIKSQLNNLLDLLTREIIDEEEYKTKKSEYQQELISLDILIQKNEKDGHNWLETTEKVFDFVSHARDNFKIGDINTKKEILHALGTSPVILNGKVKLNYHPWLKPVADSYQKVEKEYYALELDKSPNDRAFSYISSVWGGIPDSNRRPPLPQSGALTN